MLQNVEDLGAVNPPLILTLPSVAGIQVAPLLDAGANHVLVTRIHFKVNENRALGVCPSNPSLRGKGDAGRCEAAGSKKPEAYSLEYVEDVFGPRTTQMPANRLPQQNGITRADS
jgi:hypothetical protein